MEKSEIEKQNDDEPFIIFDLKFHEKEGYVTVDIKREKQEFIFYKGQLLLVAKETNEHKTELAKVIKISDNKKIVTIYFADLEKAKKDGTYKIKEKESTDNINRMLNGLEIFKKENTSLFNESIIKLIIASENEEEEETGDKKNKFSNQND